MKKYFLLIVSLLIVTCVYSQQVCYKFTNVVYTKGEYTYPYESVSSVTFIEDTYYNVLLDIHIKDVIDTSIKYHMNEVASLEHTPKGVLLYFTAVDNNGEYVYIFFTRQQELFAITFMYSGSNIIVF